MKDIFISLKLLGAQKIILAAPSNSPSKAEEGIGLPVHTISHFFHIKCTLSIELSLLGNK